MPFQFRGGVFFGGFFYISLGGEVVSVEEIPSQLEMKITLDLELPPTQQRTKHCNPIF